MVKSAIHDEEMCICNREDDRGGWEERASKDQEGNLRRSDNWVEPNFYREYITGKGVSRKSGGLIVVMKWM